MTQNEDIWFCKKKKKGLTCSSKQMSMTRKTKQMHRIHTGRLTNHLNRRRRHGG